MASFSFSKLLLAGLLLGSVSATACSSEQRTTGHLVVSIESDMAIPEQIDTIHVELWTRGLRYFLYDYEPQRDKIKIPATLTLVPGSDPGAPITIRVVGLKGGKARTLRESVTTIPQDRAAFLRMPIQWLCDESAESTASGDIVSTCDEDYTCSGGRCVEREVPEESLSTYTPQSVFGGGATAEEGTCFDTLSCMQTGVVITPDRDCKLPSLSPNDLDGASSGAARDGNAGLNVALRVVKDGICNASGSACYVPLDAASDDGFRVDESGSIVLPKVVCERLKRGRISAVVVSTSCASKTSQNPPCGPWSGFADPPDALGGAESGPTLVGNLTEDGRRPCCPLMSDETALYGCDCQSDGSVKIRAMALKNGAVTSSATFTPETRRADYSASLAAGNVYFIDRDASTTQASSLLRAVSLTNGETSTLARTSAALFDASLLLADESNLYALSSRAEGQVADVVGLTIVDRENGSVRTYPTGSELALLGFRQDAEAIYVVTDVDAGAERVSRIERLQKADGARSVVAEANVATSNTLDSGFVSLQNEGSTLYALLQTPTDAQAGFEVKLLRIEADGKQVALYQQAADAKTTRFRILGVVNGAVFLVRTQQSQSAVAGAEPSTTAALFLVPRSAGLPRVVSEFTQDAPIHDLEAQSGSAVYWLNSSGKVYRLARDLIP